MHSMSVRYRQFTALLLLFVTACTTQLAPSYDRALATGLTTVNAEVMALFAYASNGTTPDSFSQREQKYNAVIGTLDALTIQAAARPVPKNSATEAVNRALKSRGIELVNDDETPSATALRKVSATVTKMRNTDKKQGVTAYETQAFKNQASIYMDQALTYESYLER
jgi:hypothetical protein